MLKVIFLFHAFSDGIVHEGVRGGYRETFSFPQLSLLVLCRLAFPSFSSFSQYQLSCLAFFWFTKGFVTYMVLLPIGVLAFGRLILEVGKPFCVIYWEENCCHHLIYFLNFQLSGDEISFKHDFTCIRWS